MLNELSKLIIVGVSLLMLSLLILTIVMSIGIIMEPATQFAYSVDKDIAGNIEMAVDSINNTDNPIDIQAVYLTLKKIENDYNIKRIVYAIRDKSIEIDMKKLRVIAKSSELGCYPVKTNVILDNSGSLIVYIKVTEANDKLDHNTKKNITSEKVRDILNNIEYDETPISN